MDILRSPFHEDIPKAYKLQNGQGKEILVGSYAKLIKYFADYMNYTLKLVEEDDSKMSEIQKNIHRKIYNISLFSGTYYSRFAEIDFSYPLEWSNTCVMVPAKEELHKFWYIVWPFGRYIWSFLAITVIYVAYMMAYLKHPTRSFGTNLLYSLSLVMNSSNASLHYNNIPLRLQLFYSLLFTMGFIMSSYYCSFLTVYNMRPVFQKHIRTIDDALEANIKILISSSTLEELRNNKYVNLFRLSKLLQESNSSDIAEKLKDLNRSFAYVVPMNQWIFMSYLQKNLIQPIYQLSDICFGKAFNMFPIQQKAKFAPELNFFILLVKESGLWELWEQEGFLSALIKESYRLLKDEYPVGPLNVYYYRIAWIILVSGLVLGVLCFMAEILIYKYKLSFKLKCFRNKARRL